MVVVVTRVVLWSSSTCLCSSNFCVRPPRRGIHERVWGRGDAFTATAGNGFVRWGARRRRLLNSSATAGRVGGNTAARWLRRKLSPSNVPLFSFVSRAGLPTIGSNGNIRLSETPGRPTLFTTTTGQRDYSLCIALS